MAYAFNANPENMNVRLGYAYVAIQSNNLDLADTLLAPVRATGSINDIRITEAYLDAGHPEKITQWLSTYAQKHPDDNKTGLALAAAYYISGNKDEAIQKLQALENVSPLNTT